MSSTPSHATTPYISAKLVSQSALLGQAAIKSKPASYADSCGMQLAAMKESAAKKQPAAKKKTVAPVKKETAQASCHRRPSSLRSRVTHPDQCACTSPLTLPSLQHPQAQGFRLAVAKKAVNKSKEQAREPCSWLICPISVSPHAPAHIGT